MDQSDVERILSQAHGLRPQHVSDARNALHDAREAIPCGRPTRRGTPCGRQRSRFSPSCPAHSTPAEREAAAVETARLTALVDEWSNSLAPVCHAWPVTDDDRAAVAALADIDDELLQSRHGQDVLWQWQRGQCAVCGRHARGNGPDCWDYTDFVVDHDHHTALVRGYLCRSCNTGEPHSDRGDFAKYRARPPAVMLGIAVRYEHPWYGLVEPKETHAQWFARALENEPPPVT